MDKKQAGRLGGLSTVRKYGNDYMREIARRGAQTTWTRYELQPMGTSDFVMVDRITRKIIARISGDYLPFSPPTDTEEIPF